MPVEKAGAGNVGGVRKLVENAAALGMSAAQLRELLQGVDLKLSGLFGIKASDEPVRTLFADAADQLSRVVEQTPPTTKTAASPDGKPAVVEDPVAALAQKVADAKAQNEAARSELDAQKKALSTRLPEFLVGKQVQTGAAAVRELLNPVKAGQGDSTRVGVQLMDIHLDEKDNQKAVHGSLMLTAQGIRLHAKEYQYAGSPSTSAPSADALQALLTRGGITFESLALAVNDALAGLAKDPKSVKQMSFVPLDQDRLVPDPFRAPFDVAAGKADIKAKVSDVKAGPWADGATQAKERGAAALALATSLSPDKMSGADMRTMGRELLDQLNQTLRAGQDTVASLFPADAVAVCRALLDGCEHHGLTRSETYSVRTGITNLLERMIERSARAPDGTLISADANAAALSKLWHELR
jgi:hypothetical protein